MDIPGAQRLERVDAPDQGALAATAWADDGNHFPVGKGRGDIRQHFHRAERFVDMLDPDHRIASTARFETPRCAPRRFSDQSASMDKGLETAKYPIATIGQTVNGARVLRLRFVPTLVSSTTPMIEISEETCSWPTARLT